MGDGRWAKVVGGGGRAAGGELCAPQLCTTQRKRTQPTTTTKHHPVIKRNMNPNAQSFEPRHQINSKIASRSDAIICKDEVQKSIKCERRQRRKSRAASKADIKTEHDAYDSKQSQCNKPTKKQQMPRRRQ
eukprot:scaffold24708_cov73-Cyclotella_meneghiniana.AAC.1